MSSDHPSHDVNSSGHSGTSVLSIASSNTNGKASSPPNSSQGLHKSSTDPEQSPPNPFQAAAMLPVGFLDESSDGDSDTSAPSASGRSAWAPPKSPSRPHVQQPLDEGDEEGAKDALAAIAKLSMMERTHSAPGGIPFGMLLDLPGTSRPRRRLPISIPEDRAVGPTAPVEDDPEAVERPFRKVTIHGANAVLAYATAAAVCQIGCCAI